MDISDHKKFKTALDQLVAARARDGTGLHDTGESAALLQLALESAGAGVWERDLVTEIVQICPQSRRMLGRPDSHSGVITQAEWLEMVDVRDVEQIGQWVSNSSSILSPHVQEFRIQRPNGDVRWIRVSARILLDQAGRPNRLVGLMLDDTDRKVAEDALRESEERFRLVQEASLIGTFVTNTRHGTIGCSRFYHNLGLPEDAGVLSRDAYMDIVHPEDRERVDREVSAGFQSGDSLDIEYRIKRADTGEIRWIFLRLKYERAADGQLLRMIGSHLDISDSKRAETALHESKDYLRLIQETALIGTFFIDENQKTIGSRQFYRNLGLPDSTQFLDHEQILDLIHPSDREQVEKAGTAAMFSADGQDVEYRIMRADTGELRWIFSRIKFERAEDGTLNRIVGAHLDITEPKQAEAALQESEERFRMVQEAALIGTFVTDAEQRTVGSRQFYRNLGLPEDTGVVERDTYMELIHPDDRERVDRESLASIESTDGLDIEYRINRADTGELRWLFLRIKYERADDGQLIRMIGAHLDITEPKRAELALQESAALNQSMIESSADCVKLIDLDGRLLFINKQGLAALEIEDGSRILGKDWAELLPRAERHKVAAALDAARNGQTGRFNAGCPTVTGKPKWWDVVVTPICDEQGQPRQLLAISRDITEHRENLAQIHWTASHDMLTELPNRRYFQDQLDKVLARAAAQHSNVGLLQLDVDDFKQTNDALGHDAGDALLQSFTQRLKKATQGDEIVARLGGDEFAIIVPNLSDSRPLSHVVEDIRTHLAEPFIYQGHAFDCRASIGKAIFPQHGETVEALLKSTDIALYVAKTSGRGNVRRFHPSMRSNMHKRLEMIDQARTALKEDLIFPYYQPKIQFGTGAPAGFEALLRWQDANRKIQRPASIVAAFEDLDVAQALSERMQLRVLADMRRWIDCGIDFDHVAINASAAEFRQNDFAERLLNRIRAAGVPTNAIELEVTETVFLGRGAEYVGRALNVLSAEGVRIALDDFGTGYASLAHLKQFPVDVIKIDQSFVRNINIDPDDSAIIKALISLGKSLSIRIVAEGIENEAQSVFLAEQGCDYGQGYLFSRAVAAADVPKLLARLRKGLVRYQQDILIQSN